MKSHPAVYDAVVVGVPDERWGQRVAAVVQASGGHDPRPRSRCNSTAARRSRATRCHASCTWKQMQRSPSGKADYPWAKQGGRRRRPPHEQPAALSGGARRTRATPRARRAGPGLRPGAPGVPALGVAGRHPRRAHRGIRPVHRSSAARRRCSRHGHQGGAAAAWAGRASAASADGRRCDCERHQEGLAERAVAVRPGRPGPGLAPPWPGRLDQQRREQELDGVEVAVVAEQAKPHTSDHTARHRLASATADSSRCRPA